MLLAFSSESWEATFGLVVVFFIAFPILAQGLIAFAVVQGLGERADDAHLVGRWGTKRSGSGLGS